MATAYPHWVSSEYTAVTGTTAQLTSALVEGDVYVLSVTTPTWFIVAGTGVAATVGANSHFISAGGFRQISATDGASYVNVIKDTGAADGRASLSKVVLP